MQRSLAGAFYPPLPSLSFWPPLKDFRDQGGHLASVGSKDVHDFLLGLETKVFLICRLCSFGWKLWWIQPYLGISSAFSFSLVHQQLEFCTKDWL